MEILYHIPYPNGIGDDRTIYEGYQYAFTDLGHQFFNLTERHNLEKRLQDVRPDLFITSLAIIQPFRNYRILKKFRDLGGKVLMKAGWIPEQESEISKLIREEGLADIYTTELEVPHFFKLTGKELKMLPLAANKKYHFPTKPIKKYECDIIFIGARLHKKNDLFERRLFPLMKKYNVKIFGTGWDSFDKYILKPLSKAERKLTGTGIFADLRINRQVPYHEENQAYSSAKICLNFHEEQPGGVFLLNGRTFKIPASGGFEICDFVPLAGQYFDEDELVMVKTDQEFFEKVDYYMVHENERKIIQEKGTARALDEHTYHNRVQTILDWYSEICNL